MKEMIDIRIVKFEKALTMQVLEQSESLRGNEDIFDNGDMHLISKNYPDCDVKDVIYVRGLVDIKDKIISSRYFESNEERDDYFNRISRLVEDYNNRNKETLTCYDDIIFELR